MPACHLCDKLSWRLWSGRWYCRHHWHIVAEVVEDDIQYIDLTFKDYEDGK